MARPIVVPDASVILKWVLPSDGEADAERALTLRDAIVQDQVQALVPSLWLYEVGNTLARRIPVQASRLLAALLKFGLPEAPLSDDWLTITLQLTERTGGTFYDAAYHAVALVHGGHFITADAKYLERAKPEGGIIFLADWQTPAISAKLR